MEGRKQVPTRVPLGQGWPSGASTNHKPNGVRWASAAAALAATHEHGLEAQELVPVQ